MAIGVITGAARHFYKAARKDQPMHVANAFSDALRITPRTDHHLVMDGQLEWQPTKPSRWVNPHCLEALRLPMKNDTLIKNEKTLNFLLLAYTGYPQ